MERHMRTFVAFGIVGLLAAIIASTWLIPQGDAEIPVAGPVTTLAPIEMMKDVKDLPVQTIADYI
jgi:hypothetical protein